MGRYETWSAQNQRDRGSNDVQMDINLGGGDLLGVKGGKEREYGELKAKVTSTILIRMRELLNVCKSELEFFSRLEDENISLMYLVALGITTEENITSYSTMRNRGIDTYSMNSEALGKRIDSAYLREIKSMEKEQPPLLNVRGDNIEKTLINIRKDVLANPLEIKQVEESKVLDKPVVKAGNLNPYLSEKEVDLDGVLDLDEVLEEENKVDSEFSAEAIDSWKSILNAVQEDTLKVEKEGIKSLDNPTEGINRRTVYILSEEFEPPYTEKYEYVFVKNTRSLGRFTTSKNNLLVVTGDVPVVIMEGFIKWLRGLINSEDKYRIATLKNSPMKSKHITDILPDLSEKSLDDFYANHKTEDYIGSGVGTFFDLSSVLDDDDLLD